MHPDSVENSVRYSLEFHLHTSAYRIMNKRDKKTKMHRNTHYQLKKVFSVFFHAYSVYRKPKYVN